MTTKAFLLAATLAAPLVVCAETAPSGADAKPAPDLSTPAPALPDPRVIPVEAPAAPPAKSHGVLPFWGDKVRAKGFDLPEPFGVMVNYYNQKSDIEISNLKLGVNGGEMFDASGLIQVPSAKTEGSALAIRPNVMILPFFSVYAVYAVGDTQTNVNVQAGDSLSFDTLAKSGAQVVTIGGTLQGGYRGFFGVADFNAAVSDVDRLADTVGANMLSFRVGYNHKLNAKGRGIAGWVGTMGQVLEVDTKGTVRLGDVIPPPTPDAIADLRARCDALGGPLDPGRAACNRLVDRLENYDPNTTVDYQLDKKPAGVWNLILGAQYALDRAWHFRFETTFLNGRTTFLVATEFRFDVR